MPPLVLREMRVEDVPAVMVVREPLSIAGLSEVFPQDTHPFPRDVVAAGAMPPHAEQLVHAYDARSPGADAGIRR